MKNGYFLNYYILKYFINFIDIRSGDEQQEEENVDREDDMAPEESPSRPNIKKSKPETSYMCLY